MKKRFLLLLVLMVLFIGSCATAYALDSGLENFQKINNYTQGQFTDVKKNDWYADSVKAGYEYGLIKGTSATTFNPSGNITLSEAITLAARLHSIYYTGKAEFEQGNPWFQVYVDYALDNGIIQNGEYIDYSAKATRAQFATIFAAAFPESALERINNIEKIPDVPVNEGYSKAVYKLYNAGILTGNDEYGTFSPNSNIKRSEVAAIVTRMADRNLRKKISLKEKPVDAESIKLDRISINMSCGDIEKLTATILPKNAAKNVKWTSLNPEIATVDQSGYVYAHSEGHTSVFAETDNGLIDSCMIDVVNVTINVLNKLPYEYEDILTGTMIDQDKFRITDCSCYVFKNSYGKYVCFVSIAGKKTHDIYGDNHAGSNEIPWSLHSSGGIIESGSFSTPSLRAGEKFNVELNIYLPGPGTYSLLLGYAL